MALNVHFIKRSQGIDWKCGHMYKFTYRGYGEEPNPTYLHLYSFSGYHPNTGRQWRFHQGISISYLPRKVRKEFVEDWKREFLRNNGNMRLTWHFLVRKYPYLKEFTRRFFYTPNYYITNAKEIPLDDWEKEVVKTWTQDFSSRIFRKLGAGVRRLWGRLGR